MWSIVQSPPASSFSQTTQIGSRTVFAYALAFAHSVELCQFAMVSFRSSPYIGLADCFYRDALLSIWDISILITPKSFKRASANPRSPVMIRMIDSNGAL